MSKQGQKLIYIPYHIIFFIFIPWILTGLKNPKFMEIVIFA